MTRSKAFLLVVLVLAGTLALLAFILRFYFGPLLLATENDGCAERRPNEPPAPPPPRQGKPIPAGGVRSLALGGNRSCAAMNDHSVFCWGDDRQYPVAAFEAPLQQILDRQPTPPDELSLSESGYSCARFGGHVRCSTLDNDHALRSSESLRHADFVALWTGMDSVCARRQNGEVWCWGRGEPWLDRGEWLPPQHLPGLDGADDVSINSNQVCVRRGKQVFCLARRNLENLRGTTVLPGSARIESSVLVGCSRSSCAIGNDQTVQCWSEAHGDVASPVDGEGARLLERRGDAVCATNTDGRVTCWSCNALPNAKPLPLLSSESSRRFFWAGEECVLEEVGTVRCSGSIPPAGNGLTFRDAPPHRLAGIIGAEDVLVDALEVCTRNRDREWSCLPRLFEGPWARTGPNDWLRSSPPEKVAYPADTARLVVHRFAICFQRANGRATCHRRLPDGSLGSSIEIENVRRLTVGNHHACAVNTASDLLCWGANESGQVLGRVRPPSVAEPRKVLGNVLEVAIGLRHTCALTRDQRIACFGDNSTSQLGLSDEPDDFGFIPVPIFGEAIKQLVAGYEQTCALAESGQVSCWGGMYSRGTARKGIQRIKGFGSPPRELAASGHQFCALLENKTVTCWTDSQTTPVPVLGSADSVELAVGDNHSCVRTQAAQIRCWGSNVLGQLGRDLPVERIEFRPAHSCPQIEYSIVTEAKVAADVAW